VRFIVLSFGPPEFLMMTVLGLTFISVMSSESLIKGLIAGGMGMVISFVGMDPMTGEVRYAFEQLYLFDGINIVTVVIGMFAVAEVIELGIKGGSIAHTKPTDIKGAGVLQGLKDTFIHWKVTLQCSVIGSIIGIIPGMGADAAHWICYGYTAQTSKHPERFGKGAVEGVLAPESANNSKEGGNLIPTIAFGIPGGSGMAVLLGAFMILGMQPGPEMLTKHINIVFSMVWVLVFANIIAVLICLAFVGQLAKLTFVKTSVIIPFILAFAILGGFLATSNMGDIVVTLLMGGVGYGMKVYKFPRGPLAMGMVLGKLSEKYLHLSLNLFGLEFLLRPITLILIALVITAVLYQVVRKQKMQSRARAERIGEPKGTSMKLTARSFFSLFYVLFFGSVVIGALGYGPQARLIPLVVALPCLAMSISQFVIDLTKEAEKGLSVDDEIYRGIMQKVVHRELAKGDQEGKKEKEGTLEQAKPLFNIVLWILFFVALIVFFGFMIAIPVFTFLFMRSKKESWGLSLSCAAGLWLTIYLSFVVAASITLYKGLVFRLL
jgi:putative tricarboxylic transport membrane protein